jgi:hypothetical protein
MMINEMNKFILIQINNYNNAKEAFDDEKKIKIDKIKLIIDIDNEAILPEKRAELLKEMNRVNDNAFLKNTSSDDNIALFKEFDDLHKKKTDDKNNKIKIAVEFPSVAELLTGQQGGLDIDLIVEKLEKDILNYKIVIEDCNNQMKKQIYIQYAIKDALKHDINILAQVSCNKNLSEQLSNETPLKDKLNFKYHNIKGYVVDIIYQNSSLVSKPSRPSLLIKTKKGNLITKSINSCQTVYDREVEKEALKQKNLDIASKIASKKGINIDNLVICNTNLSFSDKYLRRIPSRSVYGMVKNIIFDNGVYILMDAENKDENKKMTYENGEEFKDDIHKNKFKLDDCQPGYEIILKQLNEKKNNKFIVKQLQKLKEITKQIDKLNPILPDYELKLRELNRNYDRLKEEIVHFLNNQSLPSIDKVKTPTDKKIDEEQRQQEERKDEVEREKLNKKIDLDKLHSNIDKLKQKRLILENSLKKSNPRIYELLHPETMVVPGNNKLIGASNVIQRAGYYELKKSINEVNLDTILDESNILLQKYKK